MSCKTTSQTEDQEPGQSDNSTPGEIRSDTESGQRTYYINSQADFNKYKNKEFQPGSNVLFAKGAIFNGQFAPTGTGTKEDPIVVTAYDPDTGTIYDKTVDEKPIINGQGKVNSGFYLKNGQFWEINNLEITNTDGTDSDQGDLRGIHIVAEDIGVAEHIVVKNNYVHDVNGKVAGKGRGGIHFNVYGEETPTRFDHIRIKNNVVKNVGGVGIGNRSSWPSINEKGYFPWTDVIIRGNRVERSGRNAIIIRYSNHPVVEYNVLAYSSRFSSGHSVFNFDTIDCIMQYNEAYGNTGAPDEHDHGGFDADWNAKNTIIQYNYSHDNNWFAGIMRRENKGVKIRYNISQNELMGVYFYGFPSATGVEDVEIYNNTHYFKAGLHGKLFVQAGKDRVPIETTFRNNIFFFTESGEWGNEPAESVHFENNLFYNVAPKGTAYITDNPMLNDPGKGGTDINMKDTGRLSGYQLQEGSPAIDAGIEIKENGSQDFWGNSLYNRSPDIGAYEF